MKDASDDRRRRSSATARITRPPLARTRPVRAFRTLFDPAAKASAEKSAVREGRAKETIARAVDAAYRVVEEHIREGRDYARSRGDDDFEAPVRGTGPSLRPAWLSGAGLGAAAGEMVRLLFGGRPAPGAISIPAFDVESAPAAATVGAAPSSALARDGTPDEIVVDLQSVQPARIAVKFDPPRPSPGSLTVQVLRPQGATGKALPRATVERDREAGVLTVRVRVPRGQPPGTYRALIIDGTTNTPCGSLSVTLAAARSGR
jgi:hypothetical protein